MFSIQAHLDRETAERRNIQVASLEDDEGPEITALVAAVVAVAVVVAAV